MRQKNKLYKVNKWNKPLFMPEEKNLFSDGGPEGTGNKSNNFFSADDIGKMAIEAAPVVGKGIGSAIGGKYNSSAGSAISGIGGTLGSAVGTVNPLLGAAISVGSGVVGGAVNALWGTNVDQKKLNAAREGTNALLNYNSTADNFDEITGPISVGNIQNAYSGGLFKKGWARRKNRALKNDRLYAENYAQNNLSNNIDNIMANQINNGLANYSAFGGPIEGFGDIGDLGAIDYDLVTDYLNNYKNKSITGNNSTNVFSDGGGIHIKKSHEGKFTEQAKRAGMGVQEFASHVLTHKDSYSPDTVKRANFARNASRWHSDGGFLGGGQDNLFAIGGDLESHGADWSTGATHIDEGGSHEMNPNDGVQVGVDNEGVPNLVEEGEVIFGDYVYSNRIECDEDTKKKFHISKGRKITFADLAKRLEKEVSERPNDPISKEGFKTQMENLAEQQERQKSEMEAKKAKEAFNSLSPEEQISVMSQAEQQEEQAAKQAMDEQQAMQQPNPEEMSMLEEQAVQQQPPMMQQEMEQPMMAAEGGLLTRAGDNKPNIFAKGGKKRRLAKKYGNDWFLKQARSLGMIGNDDAKIDNFEFDPNDAETNLSTFNNLYKAYQRQKALDTYIKGQRQAKKNSLFGPTGLYRIADDGKTIYKYKINGTDRNGYVDSDNKFITNEEWEKLSDDEKAKYRKVVEKAGDRMWGYDGNYLEDLVKEGTVDKILDEYNDEYSKDFKWDDKDALELNYPSVVEHGFTSNLRYAPILGSAIGLANDLFSNPDYSRANKIIKAGEYTPMMVKPDYIGDYLTYRPLDVWAGQNRLDAASRATVRTLGNTSSPARMAGILVGDYNGGLASGNLLRQAQEYNEAQRKQVADFNRGTNIQNAQMGLTAQQANQNALWNAHQGRYNGIVQGNQLKDTIDARRSASMSANLGNLFTSIGNVGEEAYDKDYLEWLGPTVLRMNAKGGRIHKKKGGKC